MAHSDAFQHQMNTLFSIPSTSKNPYESPAFNDALDALEKQLAGYSSASTYTDTDVQNYIDTRITDQKKPHLNNVPLVDRASQNIAGQTPALDWLKTLVSKPEALEHLAALLSSARSADDISSDLLDILGYESIELLPSVLEKRAEIKQELELRNTSLAGQLNQLQLEDRNHTGSSTPADSDTELFEPNEAGPRLSKKQRGNQRAAGKPKDVKFSLHPGMTIEELEQLHLQKLEEAANRPLIGNTNGHIVEPQVQYPHVYANHAAVNASSIFGSKVLLPLGTVKTEHEHYSEVSIPTPPKHPSAHTATLLPISDLPTLLQRSFPYKTLNRLQSLVYPTAYDTSENMLVCAPTGAGKTDVAVLTVLRALSMYADIRLPDGKMRNKDFKIVYVAPMKALASEIVKKMRKRFEWCGLAVRELTGDMQLTRKEIAETHMIVTTPEKWDVVTRKTTGEGELASLLRLLIIDEVHLLHEDRGAVLESIVARTLRQVESSQTLIRIVGLSATLPNYVDVADFLRVNPYVGLFFFDSSFRPVPLEQHFIASKGKPGGTASKENLDHATYDKTLDLVKDGHQVLIFVHARKDTVKTAQMLREKAIENGELEWFDSRDNPALDNFKRDLGMSRNKEMKELVEASVGIHHAGMLRSDRNISERLFEQNVTKVLVCTATLAWGVNLPAYAVIIKGTQLYDSSKGAFMDLSVLDVLQMFGRAGRPQYETHGVSYICTTSDKIDHYITAVNQQVPIESKFVASLVDSLNAEISLGTVSTIDEGVRWLGYTFLHVRMRKNPMVYGISASEVTNDPALGNRRRELILSAAKILSKNGMVEFDDGLETLASTDLGQIAAKYYLRSASIEIFNSLFRPKMTEADLLAILAKSTEFQQVAVRESEAEELKRLVENVIPCQVKGGSDTSDGKANVLLQSYISKAQLEDFALISDMEYVATNAARIARALFEIAMSRRWSQAAASLSAICKATEKRLWPWAHPLEQMSLQADLLYNLNRWAEDMSIEDIAAETPASFGKIIHLNERLGGVAIQAARQFPRLKIDSQLQPLSHDLLRVRLAVHRDFVWSEKHHGQTQYFWVWLSDADDRDILQSRKLIFHESSRTMQVDFTISMAVLPPSLNIRTISDTWLSSESILPLPLGNLILPPVASRPRRLLDLSNFSAQIDSSLYELIRSRSAIMSAFELQCMHSIFSSAANVLVCAPLGQARHQLVSTAIWRQVIKSSSSISLVLSPTVHTARLLHAFIQNDLKQVSPQRQIKIQLALDQSAFDAAFHCSTARNGHNVVIAPPTAAQSIAMRSTANSQAPTLDLLLADDLHCLSVEYEFVVSQLLDSSARSIGFSSPLLDNNDLAAWLRAKPVHTFSFSPSSRPDPITTSTTTFSSPHSAGLMKAMIKPAFDLMQANNGASICFVSHNNQCYNTLADLLTHSATSTHRFSLLDEETLSHYTARVADPKIAEGLLHGFGVVTSTMHKTDQAICKHLFQSGAIKTLILPRAAVYHSYARASLVIAMGTQYVSFMSESGERRIEDYALEDILRMQACASSWDDNSTAQFTIFTQSDTASLLSRLLSDGIPLESSLAQSDELMYRLLDIVKSAESKGPQRTLDLLAKTFLSHRLASNPAYYGSSGTDKQQYSLSRVVDTMLEQMRQTCMIRMSEKGVAVTAFGSLVRNRRISRTRVLELFECSETQATKLLKAQTGKLQPHPALAGLKAFTQRLPKSLQRRLDLVDPASTLLVCFLNKKLPPADGELETLQAALAGTLLEALTSQDVKS